MKSREEIRKVINYIEKTNNSNEYMDKDGCYSWKRVMQELKTNFGLEVFLSEEAMDSEDIQIILEWVLENEK